MAMSPINGAGCHMCGNALNEEELETIGWLVRHALTRAGSTPASRRLLLSILAKTEIER